MCVGGVGDPPSLAPAGACHVGKMGGETTEGLPTVWTSMHKLVAERSERILFRNSDLLTDILVCVFANGPKRQAATLHNLTPGAHCNPVSRSPWICGFEPPPPPPFELLAAALA